MDDPEPYDISKLDAMTTEDLQEVAATASLPSTHWSRRRTIAELIVLFGANSDCRKELQALPREELKKHASTAGIATKRKSKKNIVVELSAYRIIRDACPRSLEDLPTDELENLAKHVGLRPLHWSRRQLLRRLMLHYASADAETVALESKSLPELRALLIDRGMPTRRWSRSRCLTMITRDRRKAASPDSFGPGESTRQSSQGGTRADAYAAALERCVIVKDGDDIAKKNLYARCEGVAAAENLDLQVLARLAVLWAEAYHLGEEGTVRRRWTDEGRFVAENGTKLTKSDFDEAFVALSAAADSENVKFTAACALADGKDVEDALGDAGKFEDDVSVSDDEVSYQDSGRGAEPSSGEEYGSDCSFSNNSEMDVDDNALVSDSPQVPSGSSDDGDDDGDSFSASDTDFIDDKSASDIAMSTEDSQLSASLQSLPGGSVAPIEFIESLRKDVTRLAEAMRRSPPHLGMLESIQLLALSARNDHGFEPPVPGVTAAGASIECPSTLPSCEISRAAQSRHEGLLWRRRLNSQPLTEIPASRDQEELFVSAIMKPMRVELSGFLRRFLLSVYSTAEGMAEDKAELADVAEVLGEERRAKLVEGLLLHQVGVLQGKMAHHNSDDGTAERLVYAMRSTRRIMRASFDEVLDVYDGDERAAHQACVAIHGIGSGNITSTANLMETHRQLVGWLLEGNVGRAHLWAARILQRFAESITLAQTSSLLSFLHVAGVGTEAAFDTMEMTLRVYHSLHAERRSGSDSAWQQYSDTARTVELVRRASTADEGVVVAAQLMERFGGNLARARKANDAELRACLKRNGGGKANGRLTVYDLRRSLE